jgi:ABC-type Fe3+/spermidine/putrescine transport system ATPase subunit
MRVELRNLQRQLGLMFIHVTHNQEESLPWPTDRRHERRSNPAGRRPAHDLDEAGERFVATFMGDNNLIRGRVASREGDRLVVDDGRLRASVVVPGAEHQVGSPATVAGAAAVRVEEGAAEPGGVNQTE